MDYLNRTLEIPYVYDEADSIAIRARTGKNNAHDSIREVTIISDVIHLIEEELEDLSGQDSMECSIDC